MLDEGGRLLAATDDGVFSYTIKSDAASAGWWTLFAGAVVVGTIGSLITFYYIVAYNAPNVPLVPYKGPEDELFFDQSKYPAANQALIDFRKGIAGFTAYFQPDWVQTGQWPRNIEL